MDATLPQPLQPARRRPIVPNGVLGMLILIVSEVMFFAGMMSGFTIVRAVAMPGMWPPPGQPVLPAAATAFNTVALLLSALALFLAHRAYRKSNGGVAMMGAAWLLGATFVFLQGREWVALIAQGLTMTSSPLGSFFYLIVGVHGAHALCALALLGWAMFKLKAGTLTQGAFYATQTFWYFVVGMWPVIYARIYF